MAQSSAAQMRQWQGPALFSFGFRPFFLFGAAWAALVMGLWVLMLSGALDLPMRYDPLTWHAHALVFGYLGAIVAGFLLTAVPNWTGRLPVVGWALAGLFALWCAGRVALMTSLWWPPLVAPALDVSFQLLLGAMILREIIAGRNWRNLIVLAMLAVMTLANVIFHIEAVQGGAAAQGTGLRLGLASVLMMVAVIGGRIVPSFTRNWLVKQGQVARPAPPMRRFDKAALLLSLPVQLAWVAAPEAPQTGLGLLLLAALHGLRLLRWRGDQVLGDPLLAVLHLGYGFLPLGAACLGLAILRPDLLPLSAAQHVWMAGALGGMTLAVMTRASLGHCGLPLVAGRGTVLIYGALVASVLARLLAGLWPVEALYHLAALFWILSFGGFALLYGPMLLRARRT